MLPIDPSQLDQYSPKQIKEDVEQYGVSQLESGAHRLIDSSPTAQMMIEHYEFVDDTFLKGVPKQSLSSVMNMTLEDAEQISEIIIVNAANYYGIPITSLRVEDWARQGFEYIKEEVKAELADAAIDAMAQYGLQSISTYASQAAPLVGLVTTTAEALEDGKLSQGEAMTISTSAMTTASTVFAGSVAAAGLGVVGAVLAPAAIGTALFESINEAEAEFRRQAMQAASQLTQQEEIAINEWLRQNEVQARLADEEIWKQKELAIGSVADDWSLLEGRVGMSFQLRFFPGAPPPLRGGWYRRQPITGGGSYMQKIPCHNPAGCLYFPGSDSFLSLPQVVKFISEMRKAGYLLGDEKLIEGEYYALSPYQFSQTEDLYGGEKYAYYWRALRAFDALVPERKDSLGRTTGFWVRPGHENRQLGQRAFKDYGLLGWDVLARKDPIKAAQSCPWTGCTLESMRRAGRAAALQSNYDATVTGTKRWDMMKEATDYVDEVFDRLQSESEAVDTYRTRIRGDLLQTAGAVSGELETAKRLAEMAKQIGYRPNTQVLSSLDKAAKRDIKVLDSQTREAMASFSERNTRINLGLMLAGGTVLAAGAGTWYAKKGRR